MSEIIVTDDLKHDVLSVTGRKIGNLVKFEAVIGNVDILGFVLGGDYSPLSRGDINKIADAFDKASGFKGDKKEIAELKDLNRQLNDDVDKWQRAHEKLVIANRELDTSSKSNLIACRICGDGRLRDQRRCGACSGFSRLANAKAP